VIWGVPGSVPDTTVAEHLRSLKHLAVVDIGFMATVSCLGEMAPAERELYMAQVVLEMESLRRHNYS